MSDDDNDLGAWKDGFHGRGPVSWTHPNYDSYQQGKRLRESVGLDSTANSSSVNSTTDSGGGGGIAGAIFPFLVILYLAMGFNWCAVPIFGLIVVFALGKIASEFESKILAALTLLSLVGTGVATYLVATNQQMNTHPSFAFKYFGEILIGIGSSYGVYGIVRDAIKRKLGWKTSVPVIVGGLIIALGIWSVPYFKSWSTGWFWQSHTPNEHVQPAHKKARKANQ